MKPKAARALDVAALLVLAAGAFYAVENARGRGAWEAWRRARVAAGDRYDGAWLLPPPVPDAENFAKAPLVDRALQEQESLVGPLQLPKPPDPPRSWREGREEDLGAWASAFGARDLERALAPAGEALGALDQASRRPRCAIPVGRDWNDVPAGLLRFRGAARVLRLRALARLEAGDPDGAAQDVSTGLRILRHLGSCNAMMGHFLRVALADLMLQPVWEGLVHRRWKAAHLEALGPQLQDQDLLPGLLRWGQGERAASFQRLTRAAAGQGLTIPALLFLPRGWIYQNLLRGDRYLLETWVLAVDPEAHRIRADLVHRASGYWKGAEASPYSMYVRPLVGTGLEMQVLRAARAQVGLDEAAVACALERHRLARGAYPETLEELRPAYLARLPTDLLDGRPLRYRRRENGTFLLYSVGWNGRDEGGAPARGPQGRADPERGDWPWPEAP